MENLSLFGTNYLDEINSLYNCFTDSNQIDFRISNSTFDLDLKSLFEILEYGYGKKLFPKYLKRQKEKLFLDKVGNVVVCFSGGKDSVATAIKLRNEGYNVFLYHLKGINKSYPDEYQRAEQIAKYLDMPIHIESIKPDNLHGFKESPLKNQLVCSYALNYSILNGIGTCIAFGDFYDDNIKNSLFDRNWSDTIEMWKAYELYIKSYFPNFSILIPFKNYNETIDIISKDSKLINMVQGCILPLRFKKTIKEKNESKYGIKLLENRCGSCWKCCTEYLILADKNIVEYNKGFYKHCLDFLKSKMQEEKPNVNWKTYDDIYKAFVGKEFKESIHYKDF